MRHPLVHRPARRVALIRAAAVLALGAAPAFPLLAAGPTLLNVSYDVAREFFKEINPAFQKAWKQQTGSSAQEMTYAQVKRAKPLSKRR